VFAHNGNLTVYPDLTHSLYQPIGSTDSEAAFCYMMSELKTRFVQKPSEDELFTAMQDITHSLCQTGTF
ncbi:hypothetical protein AAUPMC_00390, partial [Pasteurella multocida subsp. multocida str. Anand1_cattle]